MLDLGGHDPADHGQWSQERYAFLFTPGSYDVEAILAILARTDAGTDTTPAIKVPVGYYTSIYGLGSTPSEVVFTSEKGVYSEEGNFDHNIGALNSFWRSAENFKTQALT